MPLHVLLIGFIFASFCAASTGPVAADSDPFSLQIGAGVDVSSVDRAGSLRAAIGASDILTAGGIADATDWNSWASARAVASGLRAQWNGSTWQTTAVELPEPVAWAAVCVYDGALLVAGGVRADGVSDRVSLWRARDDGTWTVEELARLPQPLAFAGAVVMDGVLHVAGGIGGGDGANTDLLRLTLGAPNAQWSVHPLPADATNGGRAWLEPLLVVRRDEKAVANAVFLLGGWTIDRDAPGDWAANAAVWKFIPKSKSASPFTRAKSAPPNSLLTGASGLGPAHIAATALDASRITAPPALLARNAAPADGLLRYHLFTDTWAVFSSGSNEGLSFFTSVDRKQAFLGRIDAEGRETLYSATIVSDERHFSWIDYTVMVLYMLGLVWIGRHFATRERSTEDFFLGGRRVPWWAAGLSIYATGTSAISFMAIPAKTYATDWLYFVGMSLFPFFTLTIAAFVFIPLLRRLNLTTVMEYFELRFGKPVRLLMSAITVLGQVAGRMSITLLLPSLALTAVTGMNIYACILIMGVLATLYTALGGINAVIWTDVLQVFVLFGGALLSFGLVLARVDGGFGEMITLAVANDKFNFFDWSWDFTTATMWVMLLWAVSDVFGKGLGQEGLQRAFSTKDVRDARRSMLTCAVVALPAGFLFYGIGTALYAFYHDHPQLLNPTLQNDAIFPLFIAQQLPVGLAGLVISALFAAAMSTLDTAMNTSATIIVRDFYSMFRRGKGDREQLIVAKLITFVCGAFGTGAALFMASLGNLGSLWDMFSILLGVIGGGLGGVGFLALCTTRATTYGTLAGACVTAVCMVIIQRHTPVHFFTYGTLSLVIGSTTGYLFSFLLPERKPKDLTGLTLWTPARGE